MMSASAQNRAPEILDLFSAVAPSDIRDRSTVSKIPGMMPESIGAVAIVSLSSGGARSLRTASTTGAPQRLRIVLPHNNNLVCTLIPERRESGVVAMRGTVEGSSSFSRCNLYEANGQITGDIEVDAGRFAIVPLGLQMMHAVIEVKTQALPNERQIGKD
jgi:hypothetical protein